MKYDIQELLWDTENFGVKSGKVNLEKILNNSDIEVLSKSVSSYEFIVINNKENHPKNNYLIGTYLKAFLVDINVQFNMNPSLKSGKSHYEVTKNLTENESVIEIANESFNFSRFYNDPNLNQDSSRKIYKNWVSNSFGKEEKYFILAKEDEKILGFILFSFTKDKDVVIELISMAKEIQGKGIGSKLISTLIEFANQHDVSQIKVGTQIDNLQAINFYTRNGFSMSEKSSIYHYWPRKEY